MYMCCPASRLAVRTIANLLQTRIDSNIVIIISTIAGCSWSYAVLLPTRFTVTSVTMPTVESCYYYYHHRHYYSFLRHIDICSSGTRLSALKVVRPRYAQSRTSIILLSRQCYTKSRKKFIKITSLVVRRNRNCRRVVYSSYNNIFYGPFNPRTCCVRLLFRKIKLFKQLRPRRLRESQCSRGGYAYIRCAEVPTIAVDGVKNKNFLNPTYVYDTTIITVFRGRFKHLRPIPSYVISRNFLRSF